MSRTLAELVGRIAKRAAGGRRGPRLQEVIVGLKQRTGAERSIDTTLCLMATRWNNGNEACEGGEV
jgi:hypothetical protein